MLVLASLWAGLSGQFRPSPTNTSALQPTPAPLSGAMETQNPQMAGNVPQQINFCDSGVGDPRITCRCDSNTRQNSPGEKLVFKEDFEDGFAHGFEFGPGNWAVVDDETGNKVLESNNNKEWTESIFGPDKFSDGVIEFRFRILQENEFSQSIVLYLREKPGDNGTTYNVSYNTITGETGISYTPPGKGWQPVEVTSGSPKLISICERKLGHPARGCAGKADADVSG